MTTKKKTTTKKKVMYVMDSGYGEGNIFESKSDLIDYLENDTYYEPGDPPPDVYEIGRKLNITRSKISID